MHKVLSIDGGGIRGIIPAMTLAEIERRTGRFTPDLRYVPSEVAVADSGDAPYGRDYEAVVP